MDFPKKQQQSLIPRYLLQYLQDLQISHNDPTAPWGGGGGGGSYTAGTGIDITNDVISVDSAVVALKTDLLDYVTSSELTTELSNYVTSIDLATELLDYAELSDLSTVATTGDYNDLLNKPTIPTKTSDLTNDSGYITSGALSDYVTTNTYQTISGRKVFTGEASFTGNYFTATIQPSGTLTISDNNNPLGNYMDISPYSIDANHLTNGFDLGGQQLQVYNNNNTYKIKITDKNDTTTYGEYTFKNKIGDVAITSEIPDAVSGTNDGTNWTSLTIGSNTYNIPSGGGSSYTAGTWINIDSNNNINVSNPYISLLDSNNNPRVMISSTSNGTAPTFTATYCNITPTGFGIVDKTQGPFGGYNPAYTYYRHRNILVNNKWTLSFPTDDGTIATREWVTNQNSGSYSGSYWTSITINGTTKSIPSGGSAPTNMVTTNTDQDITGTKTFVGPKKIGIRQANTTDVVGFTVYDTSLKEIGNLQVARRVVGSAYTYVTLGNYSDYSAKAKVGFRIQPNSSTNSYNFVMPYGTNTQFTSNTYSTSSDTTIPCAFTDGTTIVKADATGLVNISSISGGGGGGTSVSGTNNGTNWTSITIGPDTYGIPSGGGGGSATANLFLHNFRMIITTYSNITTAIEATILTKSSNQILTVAELTSQIAALQATQYDDSVVGVIYGQWYRRNNTARKESILGFGLTGTAASPNLYMVVPNGSGPSSPIDFMSSSAPTQTIQWVNGLTNGSGYEVTAECTDVVTPAVI